MIRKLLTGAVAVSLIGAPIAAEAATKEERAAAERAKAAEREEIKKLGSNYLRCDGQPNNMTDAESFARFIGAVTLLALFAPPAEAADPSKRQFGEKGVEACSKLLDDPKQETNGLRRIPLMLARGVHRIEAKDYAGAIADVELARAEAKALNLIGNPYFDRSMGRSFDQVEAAARLRMDDAASAETISLRGLGAMRYSYYPLITTDTYDEFTATLTPERERQLDSLSRMTMAYLILYADRLDDVGRFADAARKRESLIRAIDTLSPDEKMTELYASAALSHALAGEWDRADERAAFARTNLSDRKARGKPEEASAAAVEVLDLVDILRLTRDGKMKEARRSFAARSQWLSPSFGAVMETNRRLRPGATTDELFGALAKTPEELWAARRDDEMARRIALDADNKVLFYNIKPYTQISLYEGASKNTWRTDKSKLMGKEPVKDTKLMMIYGGQYGLAAFDVIMLHAALAAKARGKQGFLMDIRLKPAFFGMVLFVNQDDPDSDPERYISADEVIAELTALIPSPEMLAARKKAK
jgi:hypothetical protein